MPTALGGTILVGNFLGAPISMAIGAGGGVLPVSLPGHPSFLALPLFAQQVQIDGGASAQLSFSAGVALRVGI